MCLSLDETGVLGECPFSSSYFDHLLTELNEIIPRLVSFQEVQEIDMMREEMPNSGPRTEMRFWRQRATRFNLIMKEMNTPLVKKTLNVLTVARSNTLPVRPIYIPSSGSRI